MSDHLLHVDHIGIVVRNLDASIAWYERHLGFERVTDYGFPGAKVAFIGRDSLRLELFEVEQATPMAPERSEPKTNLAIGGINHVAIAVDDLEAAVAALERNGVEIATRPADVPDGRGDRFAFSRDNERMLIELFQPAR